MATWPEHDETVKHSVACIEKVCCEPKCTVVLPSIFVAYPVLHSSPLVQHEVVANYSLLYFLRGSDTNLKPYMLMGHLDVVPVPDESVWEMPPFGADIKDDFIYGRGTIDNKQTVFVSI